MSNETDRRWVDSMPEAYERWLVPALFRPFAVELARRASARSPRRILELAAGTGVLTRELIDATAPAKVTATDLNPAMIDFGRELASGATWELADAGALPFEAGQFDLVACQFGVMFFPDKPAAFAEARRVLAADGRLLFNTWSSLETNHFAAALMAGLERAFPEDPPSFVAAFPHGYSDVDTVLADLEAGGLSPLAVETVELESSAASAADLATGFCTGTPLRAAIEARGDLATALVVVTGEMERRLGSGHVTGTMTAHVVEARPAA